MTPTTLKPQQVGVFLRKGECKKWDTLATLDSIPSRYPNWGTLTSLGIKQSWDLLAESGHLTYLFTQKFGSYKALTVEFFTTLHVETSKKKIESMSFRLFNEEHNLTVVEFNQLFKLTEEGEEGLTDDPRPADYNRDEFWRRTNNEETFNPSRAKINAIRNPVLRYMMKAFVYFPFGHTEAGSMSTEMLFLLWGMLSRRRVNTGHFMIKHLERQTKKTNGKLCCGGLVAALAYKFGVSFEGRTADQGSMILDWDTLKKANMIMVDGRGVGYFKLDASTCIRFPDPPLFAVGGWSYQDNWKMNTQAHLNKIESDPPQGDGPPDATPVFVDPAYMPQPHIPEEPLQLQNAPAHMDEDDDEVASEHEVGQSSRSKRSRPRGRPSRDSYLAEIAEGVRAHKGRPSTAGCPVGPIWGTHPALAHSARRQ